MRYALILMILLAESLPAQAQDSIIFVKQADTTLIVSVTDMVHNNLDFAYTTAERADLENMYCVLGRISSTALRTHMSGLSPVWIDSASGNNLFPDAGRCPRSGTIGTIHFHLGLGACGLSSDDISAAHVYPWPIMAIVCRETPDSPIRIVVVHRKKFDEDWHKLKKGELVSVAKDTGIVATTYRYRNP